MGVTLCWDSFTESSNHPVRSRLNRLPMRETARLQGPCTTSWVLHSFLGDRIICRWFFFFFFWLNRVGSNLHSALIRLIQWLQNKNYFLWLHREFPDPDGGQGTLLGSDKGGQGTPMTRLENRKCPERDGNVVRSWGGVSKRKSQMGVNNSKIPT